MILRDGTLSENPEKELARLAYKKFFCDYTEDDLIRFALYFAQCDFIDRSTYGTVADVIECFKTWKKGKDETK